MSEKIELSALDRVVRQCEKVDSWKHLMSYNDSYFGEPEGELKASVYEIGRNLDGVAAIAQHYHGLKVAVAALLDSAPKNMCARNAKEREAYKALRRLMVTTPNVRERSDGRAERA